MCVDYNKYKDKLFDLFETEQVGILQYFMEQLNNKYC